MISLKFHSNPVNSQLHTCEVIIIIPSLQGKNR